MEYPVMYAETRRLPIEKQEIGDYWSVMDGYSLRTDKNALQSLDYIGMLMRYMFFVNEKKAHESVQPTRVLLPSKRDTARMPHSIQAM